VSKVAELIGMIEDLKAEPLPDLARETCDFSNLRIQKPQAAHLKPKRTRPHHDGLLSG
jgi:hypothetical protein